MKFNKDYALKNLQDYLSQEPNEQFRQQAIVLGQSSDEKSDAELIDRFAKSLRFGTAGIRSRMEAGYNRMNLVSVFRFCYSLAHILKEKNLLGSRIVIGFDGRNFSEEFARESCSVFSHLGFNVLVFNEPVPTPICAYATKNLTAKIGLMITASHNPSWDNGIKLFGETSAQLCGDILQEIESNMVNAPMRNKFFSEAKKSDLNIKTINENIFSKYLDDLESTRLFSELEIPRTLPIVYTPLHGVGKKFFIAAAKNEKFKLPILVSEQEEANGNFPTVDFPNPEEDGALDLAHDLANKNGISYVLANDPDADRLQVSCLNVKKQFQKLSGNEIGIILAYFAIMKAKRDGVNPLVATSIVSSRMLHQMAHKSDVIYVDGLTGFSNIINSVLKVEAQSDAQLIFAYEEAIGFLLGKIVLDKDGISAGLRFMEIINYLESRKVSVWQFLDELYTKFGLFLSTQWSQRFSGTDADNQMSKVMQLVRSTSPESFAKTVGIIKCSKSDLMSPNNNSNYFGLLTNAIVFEEKKSFRLFIRPSGTEPKIKFYLELSEPIGDSNLLETEKYNLIIKLEKMENVIKKLFGLGVN